MQTENIKRGFLAEYWNKVHLPKNKKNNLDPVCCTGNSYIYNKMVDVFQKITFSSGLKRIGEIRNLKALDIGCGRARWCKILHSKGAKTTGVDISKEAILANRALYKNIEFINSSLDELSLPPNSFDLVTSVTVLQHVPYSQQGRVLQNINNCLKYEGFMFLMELVSKKENESFDENQISFPHTQAKWSELFEKHGFEVIYQEPHLFIPLVNNFYIPLRRGLGRAVKRTLGIKSSDSYTTGSTGATQKTNRQKISDFIDFAVLFILSFPSFLIEPILVFLNRFEFWRRQEIFGSCRVFLLKKK